jgi:hypothetical protein
MILFIKGLCAGIGIAILITLLVLGWMAIWVGNDPEFQKHYQKHIE